jgi:predicted permease
MRAAPQPVRLGSLRETSPRAGQTYDGIGVSNVIPHPDSMPSLKLAFRTLSKTPFVTTIAVASLALGIGANAAVFSLFDQMLLRPLPVVDPNRLVNLTSPGPKPGQQQCGTAGDCDVVFSYPMFRDLEKTQSVFTGIAAHVSFGASLALRGRTPLGAEGMLVSGSYFPVLGLRPALGRLFTPADDQTVGANYVAVLSYNYWQTQLGADPAVLNAPITINGKPMTVIGVAPRGFDGTTLGVQPKIFVPINMRRVIEPNFNNFENRRSYWVYLFGRLKAGVSMDRAATALNALYHPIITDVEAPLQKGMSDKRLVVFKAKKIVLEDGWRGQSSVHGDTRTPLILLFSISAVVLLIACANIANLLLARAASRSMEMAVRLSLGATRRQLLAQLLTESCLLAVLGGVVSLIVARSTLALISSLLPSDTLTTLQFQLDPSVVIFAGALALGTGVLFGLFPAVHSTRPDLVTIIRANTGQPSGARAAARFRASLVTAQIALSMALLISAGLFVKSLMNVSRVKLGLRTDHVITFAIAPALNGYRPEQSRRLFERVEQDVAATPGVTNVSSAIVPLLAGNNWGNDVAIEGFKSDPDTDMNSRYNEVGPDYFKTIGVTLLGGREFTTSDALGAPKVVIVNETFAKKFNLGRAVGKHMAQRGTTPLDMEIVGLVQDAKYSEVKQTIPPVFFVPYRQDSTLGFNTFYVRTSLPPEQLLRTIPGILARIDPQLPVVNLKTLPQQVRESIYLDRMISTLSTSFAALATLLAAVGLYGVLAYTVTQRTREIGVRMALGADGSRVRAMVLRQVARMAIIGGAIGLAAAFALGRTAQSLLYGLEAHDPIVMTLAAVVLGIVALAAGYIPALRASRVHPMQALRYE